MPARVIREMNWVDIASGAKETDLCIVPVGSAEVYGPHLPVGADGIVAEYLARQAAESLGAFVTPLIPVGFAHSLQEMPGTLSVQPEALKAYVQGVVESCMAWGLRRFLFINGHLSNVGPITEVVEELKRKQPNARFVQVDIWRFVQPHANPLMESPNPHGHAAEAGTSVLLAICPQWVKMERAVNNPFPPNSFPEFIQYRSFKAVAPQGTLGDATKGTAEKGREILRRCVDRIVEFLKQL